MGRQQVGVIKELFRYPVKSMLGERVLELDLTEKGVVGDRAWALREANGRIVTAKKWANMLGFRATYENPPTPDELAPVRVTLPDGRTIHAADADASAVISSFLGREVTLVRAHADENSRAEIDPRTVFSDVAVERVVPEFTAATLPDSFRLRHGTFFDSVPIHLLTTGSLAHMRSLIGADAQLDPRRFRPNIVIETDPQLTGFVEDEWLDGTLEAGASVKIVKAEAALRCVMTTHPQDGLPRDLRIFRAAAEHHQAKVGIFAMIGAPGKVHVGDRIWLVK